MNPNTAQSLDPKLKETYDRVMGTQLNTPAQQTVPAPAPEQPKDQVPQTEMVNINATAATAPQNQTAEKKSKLRPVVFIAAGIFFFVIYTVIWLKFFSVI